MPSKLNQAQLTAIFGGTFDPPHLGHLHPLQETADILKLSKVKLMPANVPALKNKTSDGHHRIEMTRLLCELDPRFTVDLTEFERDSISYTVDTLIHIKQKQPDQAIIFIIGLDSLLSLHKWHRWEDLFDYCHLVVMLRPALNIPIIKDSQYQAIPKVKETKVASNLYDFHTSASDFENIVGESMDQSTKVLLLSKLAQPENNHCSINHASFQDIIRNSTIGNLWFIKNHVLPVSSTNIRRQIKAGKTTNNLVPKSVLDYINKHQLYIN